MSDATPTNNPETPPATIKLERSDALELENSQLRMQLSSRAVDDANRALQEEMRAQAITMGRLSHKLGHDISQYQYDPRTGTLMLRQQVGTGQNPPAPEPEEPPTEE